MRGLKNDSEIFAQATKKRVATAEMNMTVGGVWRLGKKMGREM